jgi:hypothetical protein
LGKFSYIAKPDKVYIKFIGHKSSLKAEPSKENQSSMFSRNLPQLPCIATGKKKADC